MADNNLDALVYVYTTIPAPLVYPSRVAAVYEPRVLKAGTKMPIPISCRESPVSHPTWTRGGAPAAALRSI
jgi:hypothetical protein